MRVEEEPLQKAGFRANSLHKELASYNLLRVAGSCTSDDLVQKSVLDKEHGGARHRKLRAVTKKTAS